MAASNKLSIYLIKDGINDNKLIIKSYSHKIEILNVGIFFTAESNPQQPAWLKISLMKA